MDRKQYSWTRVSAFKFLTVVSGIGLFIFLFLNDEDQYIRIIDDANFIFHEAGHIIFGLFGTMMGLYGGTFGQLMFPAAVSIYFWFKRESIGLAVGLLWLFENFFNISRYMADARAQQLPLLAAGGHDWRNIFIVWNVLPYDTMIAQYVSVAGWIGILVTMCWLAWRWRSDDERNKIW